jgi:aminopeptidase N
MSVASSRSLLHSEALERRALLDVTSYDVRLDLADPGGDESVFGSVTTIVFESRGGATFVDLKPVRVASITLNDRPVDVDELREGRLPVETVAGTNVLVVEATMPYRNDGEGLHLSVDPADGRRYLYGMSFMDAAPTVFACFDQPDLKAPYTLHVRAPRDWVVVGNAPATNPEPGTWEIGPTQPLSTYFVTLVAGPYHVLRDEHDGTPLGLSARQSLAVHLDKDADELFTLTRQSFDEMHRLFGVRYPFGDYHQAFVPEFNAGAMENPGCVTFRDQMVFDTRVTRGTRINRATTVAHEMAHQWFGNLVTPAWWDDLWLNESFAEYMGNRVTADVTEYADAWTHVSRARRQWGLLADQRPTTHPVAGNGAADAVAALQNFDGISYAKGSSILRQLATSLGDEVFFAGVVDHFTRHRFGNATMHDLFASWERAGAGDLAPVVDQWLRTAGADVLEVDRDAGVLRRTAPVDHPAERTHRFEVVTLAGGVATRTAVDVTGPETPYDAGAGAVVIDPDEVSWGVYVPDAATVAALGDELPQITDGVLRAGAWNNVKSGVNEARVAPDDVVDLLVAAFPVDDTEDTARHTVPWMLGEVLPAASPGSRGRVHAAVAALVDTLPPGSEHQLAAFRAAVRTADDVDLLQGWLDRAPDGIEADSDVRWRLLVQLAALGGTDQAALDAALADDPDRRHPGAPRACVDVAADRRREGPRLADVRRRGRRPQLRARGRRPRALAGIPARPRRAVRRALLRRPAGHVGGAVGLGARARRGGVLPAHLRRRRDPRPHAGAARRRRPRARRAAPGRRPGRRARAASRRACRLPGPTGRMRDRRPGPSVRRRVREGEREREDRVVTEEPLEIRLQWPGAPARRVWVTMRTPGHDFELAAGWVLHEGIAPAVHGVAYCTDVTLAPDQEFNVVTVTLDAPPTALPHQHDALSAGSSACGVCGRDSVSSALATTGPRWAGDLPGEAVVRRLPELLRERQRVFDRTGGVHAAGLATADGSLLVVREDVGRHNAVDKVTGARVLAGEPAAGACLVVSGRAGFELVQKAVAAGTGSLAAVGAPTSLAVDLATRAGLALYGFTSADRTVRYA